jgi:uncharacterized protein
MVAETMEIAIISDTHMPRGSRRLSQGCVDRLQAADLILHAGDLSTIDVLLELEAYAPVIAIHGNVDDPDVRARLPAQATVELERAKVGLIHDAGPAIERVERMRKEFPLADAVVFGHSHIPVHERALDGFQIFNPGSPTERRRAPHHTMGIASLNDGKLKFELIQLD